MEKISKNKIFIAIEIVVLLALLAFSITALKSNKLTSCGNEQDHFIDEQGNGYCIAEELVNDFESSSFLDARDNYNKGSGL